jgi:hypothetical protein
VIPHVHTPGQKVETWGVNGMKAHLEHDHPDVSLPMRWGRAELHQAHLKAHQTSEESPVTENPEPEPERVNQPTEEGQHRILLDRMIAALSDIDFDHAWVKDESRTMRGVMRALHDKHVGRLLAWLERGGALEIPQVRSLADDLEREKALVLDMETTNSSLWAQLRLAQEANQRQVRTITELEEQLATDQREQGRSLDAAQRALEEAVAERDLLRGDKARLKADLEEIIASRDQALEAVMGAQTKAADLRSQLEESERRRQGMFEEMGELRLQLDTATTTRDRAMEAGWILERQRNEAIAEAQRLERLEEERQVQHAEVLKQLEEAQADARHLDSVATRAQNERTEASSRAYKTHQQLERVERLLTARTEALATGQAALGALLSDLRREGWAESILFKKLSAILAGTQQQQQQQQPDAEVATSVESPGEANANLGLVTTGELIEEVRTRIDMGHCGLGYRTVDGDL